MHQRLYGVRHEAVADKEVLLDAELGVAPFEVAGAVLLDTMAQRQVLGARWGADRVGLHKTEPMEGAFQRGGREEAVGDGKTPQVVESDQHYGMLPEVCSVMTLTSLQAYSNII